MSTFLQILPTANVDPSQGEQNTSGFSDEPKNLPGVFEKMMTQALSAPTGAATKEGGQSSQIPVQPAQISAHFSNKMAGHAGTPLYAAQVFNSAQAAYANLPIQSKTVALNQTNSKAATQAGGTSNKDKKTETADKPASAPTSVEAFLAVPVLTVEPIGNSGGKAPKGSGSDATSQAGATEPSAVLPAPARTNSISATASKVTPPLLSATQMAPMVEVNAAAQQTNASEAKETALSAKSSEATLPQANPTVAMALKSSDVELPESQTATGVANPDHGDSTARVSDSNAGAVAQPPPDANGTSIAKQDMTMNQAEKTNEIAGQTEKVLPGSIVSASHEAQPSGVSLNAQSFMPTAAGSPALNNIDGMSSSPSDSVAASAVMNARSSSLERTQELVMVSATRLSDSGNNSMQVVIKPDTGTQLSLELRQQGGSVQVQASLQQGDFNHLNQQWPDLQQRLEDRGIRLAPLTDDGASGSNNGESETFQNKQNQANEVVPELTLVDAPAGIFTHEPAQTSSHRGWETWA